MTSTCPICGERVSWSADMSPPIYICKNNHSWRHADAPSTGTVGCAPGTPSAFHPLGTFGGNAAPDRSAPHMVSLAAVKAWLLDHWEGYDSHADASGTIVDNEYKMLIATVTDIGRDYTADGRKKP